jgi:hypothetical protein
MGTFMIAYRDFAPRQLTAPALLRPATLESLDEALAAANDWIETEKVDVVNVETVVLPNVWSPHQKGTTDPQMITQSEFAVAWNQFIRVWYRVGDATPAD